MNLKQLITTTLLSLILFSSCLDDNIEDLATKGYITEFRILDQNGYFGLSNIDFTIIEAANSATIGSITNVNKLFPYGSTSKPLQFLFNVEGHSDVLVSTTYEAADGTERDTAYSLISGRLTIDFSVKPLITVISEDGKESTVYRVDLQTSPLNPQAVKWQLKTDSVEFGLKPYASSFYLNDKLFVLTGDITPGTNSVYTKLVSSVDGSTWQNVSLPADFPRGIYHSVQAYNGKVYIIGYVTWDTVNQKFLSKEEIWSSANGVDWVKEAYPSGMKSVFKNVAVYNNKLMVWGGADVNGSASTIDDMLYSESGTLINPDYSLWSFDGVQWEKNADITSDMANRFSTAVEYRDRFQVFGGEVANGSCTDKFWSLSQENDWYNFPISNLGALYDCKLFVYDEMLWMFGGNLNERTENTIQVSKDGGAYFYPIEYFADDEMYPDLNYNSRANALVEITPDNRIFTIGGYEIMETKTINENPSANEDSIVITLDRQELFDVWSGKMNKY